MFIIHTHLDLLYRLEHAKLHEKHKGHEAMHLEMVMILFATLFVMQIVLFKWQQLHSRSYKVKLLQCNE